MSLEGEIADFTAWELLERLVGQLRFIESKAMFVMTDHHDAMAYRDLMKLIKEAEEFLGNGK